MGIYLFGGRRCCTDYTAPAPDPKNFIVHMEYGWGLYKAYKVNYPNCTNFEGDKILVTKGKIDKNAKDLDPHFGEDNNIMARFRPGEWQAACDLVDYYEKYYNTKRPNLDKVFS